MNPIITAPIIAQTALDATKAVMAYNQQKATHYLEAQKLAYQNQMENRKMNALMIGTVVSPFTNMVSEIHGQTLAYRQATERTEAELEIASQHHQRELQKITNDQQNAKRHMKMVKKGHAKHIASLEQDKAGLREQLKLARDACMDFQLTAEQRAEARQYATELQSILDGVNYQYHQANVQLADNLRMKASAGGRVYDGDFVEKDD